jgi:hypothetical protein
MTPIRRSPSAPPCILPAQKGSLCFSGSVLAGRANRFIDRGFDGVEKAQFPRGIVPPKKVEKKFAISTQIVEYLIHIKSLDIQPMKNMKSILAEIILIGQAIVFWGVALPAAVVIFPAIALWETIGAALARGTAGPGCTRPSPLAA